MIPAGSRSRITLVVAANGPRTMRIAAGADGWATTGPESTDATTDQWWTAIAGLVQRFEDTAAQAGRDPNTMGRYLNLDSAPVLSVSSLDAFTDAAGRAAALGFTDVVVHWPRPTGVYAGDESVLDAIADLLTDGACPRDEPHDLAVPSSSRNTTRRSPSSWRAGLRAGRGLAGGDERRAAQALGGGAATRGTPPASCWPRPMVTTQSAVVGNQLAGRVGFFLRVDDFDAALGG